MSLLKICENRFCRKGFEPDPTTLKQPIEKQQRFCCRDCREQTYQIGKYTIRTGCTVEISWPLLSINEQEKLYDYLEATHGYGIVTYTNVNTKIADVEIDGETFELEFKQLVRV